jgi:hypothetical protein
MNFFNNVENINNLPPIFTQRPVGPITPPFSAHSVLNYNKTYACTLQVWCHCPRGKKMVLGKVLKCLEQSRFVIFHDLSCQYYVHGTQVFKGREFSVIVTLHISTSMLIFQNVPFCLVLRLKFKHI